GAAAPARRVPHARARAARLRVAHRDGALCRADAPARPPAPRVRTYGPADLPRVRLAVGRGADRRIPGHVRVLVLVPGAPYRPGGRRGGSGGRDAADAGFPLVRAPARDVGGRVAGTRTVNDMRGEEVVAATGLTKRFRGGVVGVDGLDLSVARGEVF